MFFMANNLKLSYDTNKLVILVIKYTNKVKFVSELECVKISELVVFLKKEIVLNLILAFAKNGFVAIYWFYKLRIHVVL